MASEQGARLVWFWTFWHWSQESFRDGVLLRSPLQGVGSHWDEWYRHEASVADRVAIAQAGLGEMQATDGDAAAGEERLQRRPRVRTGNRPWRG